MTILKTFSEKETKEETKFGIVITKFKLEYWDNEGLHIIRGDDLKEYYSIQLFGINKKDKKAKS